MDITYQIYTAIGRYYLVFLIVMSTAFVLGVIEYLVTKSQKINSRMGMRIIVASVLIFLLVTGIYVLLGTLVGLNSGSSAN